MNPVLLETFCLQEGKLLHLPYHQERIALSLSRDLDITHFVKAIERTPDFAKAQKGKWRASIIYSSKGIEMVRLTPYTPPRIIGFHPIEIEKNFYSLKWADRSRFEEIKQVLPIGVEPLFILDGKLTDTTFTNVVLEDGEGTLYTPTTYLLRGTKRTQLLERGILQEREVPYQSLFQYHRIHLINAMLDPGEVILNISTTHTPASHAGVL